MTLISKKNQMAAEFYSITNIYLYGPHLLLNLFLLSAN